jgi:omega-hydroxy-beta-dihydromenaquinone-9 sulfotransferase
MVSRWPFAPLVSLLWAAGHSGGVSLRRLPLWGVYLLRYLLFEPLRLVERLLYDRAIEQHEPDDEPLFILGHWRSGTSHLQTLLYLDPRFTTSTVFRSMFSDVFLLTEGWLAPLLNRLARLARAPFSIQRIPMDVDTPAEADLGLCCLGSRFSYTWGHLFPASFGLWMQERVLAPSPEIVAGWLDAYDWLQRKLSYAAGGKRVVLKSPGDTARVAALACRYPMAKFVFIHRDPVEVFHSNRYLWEVVLKEHGVQTLASDQVDAMIIEHHGRLLDAYTRQRAQLGSDRLVEVRYEDLRDEPVATLEGIYAQLGLGELSAQAVLDFVNTRGAYTAQAYVTSPELRGRLAGEMSAVESEPNAS